MVVAQRTGFFETVLPARARASAAGSTRVHLEIYELLPPVIGDHPLFGLGLNTFSSVLRVRHRPVELGAALVLRRAADGDRASSGRRSSSPTSSTCSGASARCDGSDARSPYAGDAAAARVRPLGWGLTAALVGTLVANAFYLTMQMYYFFVLAMLVFAAPLVFGRRLER